MDQLRPLYATLPPRVRAKHRRLGTLPEKLHPIPDDLKGLLRRARSMGAHDVAAEIRNSDTTSPRRAQIVWFEPLLRESEVLDDDAAHGRVAAGTAA